MVLFENTLALCLLLGLFLVSALIVRRFISGDSAQNKAIVVVTILTVALVAAGWLIETPREHITAICRELAQSVDEGDVDAIGRRMAADFSAYGVDREAFLDRMSSALTRTRLDQVRIRAIEITMEGDSRAFATFGANCNVRSAEGFAAALPTRWRLRFTKHRGQWLLQEVESIPVPPLNLRNPLSRL